LSEGCVKGNIHLLKNDCEEAGIGNLINISGNIKICINKKESVLLSNTQVKTFHKYN